MIELPLVFLAGLLGSAHCIGMCGPFALTIGSAAPTWISNVRRQALYSCGRIFTYSTIGAVAGFCGLTLSRSVPAIVNLPAVLALVAGGLLIQQGLIATGWIGRRSIPAGAGPCLTGSFLSPFLGSSSFLGRPGGGSMFLAGMFTGLLPCGLVYAFVALAASSASMAQGATTLAVFGLGTVPIMMLTGFGGSLLSLATRQRILQLAAWCVVLAGAVSVVRGASFIAYSTSATSAVCPLCPPVFSADEFRRAPGPSTPPRRVPIP